MFSRLSTIAWAACLFAGIALFALSRNPAPRTESPTVAGSAIGGPFSLVDQDGRPVTEKSWPGQYLLVYFGFTHCPDICPVGLGRMIEALDALPAATQARIQPVFITLDPARDTPAELKNYVAAFSDRLTGLSGTADQVAQAVKTYRVYAAKQGDGKDYMINHSGFTYLMGPDGKNAAIFAHETSAKDMAASLEKIVGSI